MGEKLRVAIVGGGVGGLSALWVSLITFTVPSNWRVTDRVLHRFYTTSPKMKSTFMKKKTGGVVMLIQSDSSVSVFFILIESCCLYPRAIT